MINQNWDYDIIGTNSLVITINLFYYLFNSSNKVVFLIYRRLLQMGVYNAELLNNLGLCCFYAQQWDHTISCFERALSLATNENAADIWYNISQIAIVSVYFFHA